MVGIALSSPAWAVDEVAARRHFEKATRAFEHKSYEEAVREYLAAYRATNDATLLFNVAQSHKLGGHPSQALQFFKMYLQNTPDASDRKEVQREIAELERTLERQRTASQPTPTPRPAVAAPTPTPPAPSRPTPPTFATGPGQQQPNPEAARRHYDAATKALELKLYDEAAREYRAAYLAAPDGLLLFNIAQGYRLAGRATEAIEYYRMYLNTTPDASDRPEVERRIVELERTLSPAGAEVPAPGATVEPQSATGREHEGRAKTIAGVVIGVIGLGAAATGIAFSVMAKQSGDSLEQANHAGAVFDPALERTGQTDSVVGGVLVGVGAAAAVTGIVLLAVGRSEARRAHGSAPLSILPSLSPRSAGALVTVGF